MSKGFNLSDEDFKRKSFKTAPGGIYYARITTKSKIKPGKEGGETIQVHAKIVKGPHKGVTFFDNIAMHVSWKVGQLLNAIGKKVKKGTAQLLLKIIANKDVRVQLREETWNGRKQNKVVTWLPLKGPVTASAVEDDEDETEDADDAEEQDEDAEDETDEDAESTDENEDEDETSDDEDETEDEDEDEDETEEDDEDADEEDEDEDEPAPKKKKVKKAKKGKRK